MAKEEKKDEMKNRISMALKDPLLQQCFEIICKNLTVLEDQIADIKANCDLAIEGRDVKIKELERENEQLKSIADFQQSSNMGRHFEIQKLKKENAKLKAQIEKMKRHCNCKHRDSEGYCEVKRTYLMDLSYDGCDKWELED